MKQVIEYAYVCPYCMDNQDGKIVCCGENHFELAYEDREGNILLESELQGCEIVDKFEKETNRFYIERDKYENR